MPVEETPAGGPAGLPSVRCRALRRAESEYWRDGRVEALEQAGDLLDGCTGDLAVATRWWLSLLRADRDDDATAVDRCISTVDGLVDHHPAYRLVLAAALFRRCARDGGLVDLDRAVDLRRAAADEMTPSEPLPLWSGPTWSALELGTALLERFRLRGAPGDLTAAVESIRRARPSAAAVALRALRLARLAACDHEDYGLTGRRSSLARALRRYRRALDGLGDSAPARPLLLTELGTVYQDRFEDGERRPDLQEALRLAELAVATEPGTGVDLTCHLVNLGTAQEMAHAEDIGDHRPLLDAVDCWRRALRHLPAGSPYRAVFLDRLALGLIACVDRGLGGSQMLSEAVDAARAAVRRGASSAPAATLASNLAHALTTRWEIGRAVEDLDEAVDVLEAAVRSSSVQSATGPYTVMNLVQLRISRYSALGDAADLDHALAELDRLGEVSVGRGQRGWWHAARAHLELIRYTREGRRTQLSAAIDHARRLRNAAPAGSAEFATRSGYLSAGLYQRYLLGGRKRDLDAAISVLDRRDEGEQGNADRMSVLLQVRYERYGDPADGRAAARWAELASADADHGSAGGAATHGLAFVLHGRFENAGRLADLNEVVQRHRDALADLHAGAPTRAVVLSNLGIALQDRFVYLGRDADLDEAITIHQQAADAVPASSPDRAGLLHSLAAAVQVRATRDEDLADIARAVDLDEQALAALPPRSPERAEFLANLAASRRLQARHTGRRDHADEAVATFRALLARPATGRPMRAHVLHGYGRALADRYDRFGRSDDRRRATAAHRRAVAEAGANVVLLMDAASDWAEWSGRHRRWGDAAAGWLAAGAARWHLFGLQADPVHANSWLNRGEEIAGAGGLALVRCDRAEEAAVVLDTGRALGLSQVVDHRGTIERLRSTDHHDLAARLDEALSRMAAALRAADHRPSRRPLAPIVPGPVQSGHSAPSG